MGLFSTQIPKLSFHRSLSQALFSASRNVGISRPTPDAAQGPSRLPDHKRVRRLHLPPLALAVTPPESPGDSTLLIHSTALMFYYVDLQMMSWLTMSCNKMVTYAM